MYVFLFFSPSLFFIYIIYIFIYFLLYLYLSLSLSAFLFWMSWAGNFESTGFEIAEAILWNLKLSWCPSVLFSFVIACKPMYVAHHGSWCLELDLSEYCNTLLPEKIDRLDWKCRTFEHCGTCSSDPIPAPSQHSLPKKCWRWSFLHLRAVVTTLWRHLDSFVRCGTCSLSSPQVCGKPSVEGCSGHCSPKPPNHFDKVHLS